MIRDNLIATECNIIATEAELLWIEIHTQGQRPLIIGLFYRPPHSAPSNLQQLADNISDIQQKYKNAILVQVVSKKIIHFCQQYYEENTKSIITKTLLLEA